MLLSSPSSVNGKSSTDDDILTTDADFDDDEAMSTLLSQGWHRPSVASAVIEEDDDRISDDDEDEAFAVDGSELRRRLWAQSLLRLTRSIDEIYSLCEYESDEIMCEQVKDMLLAASQDFVSLTRRFESQQEYTLLPGEFPLKTGVAWTTRMPTGKASKLAIGECPLEVLERVQSPTGTSRRCRTEQGRKCETPKSRSRSLDPTKSPQRNQPSIDDTTNDLEGVSALASNSGGTGEAAGPDSPERYSENQDTRREGQLHCMVAPALENLQNRLRQSTKLNPEEVLKRSEDRQKRARQLRSEQEEHKAQQMRLLGERVWAARQKRQLREQQKQNQLLEKMTRARRQYQEQLRLVCERARNENRKASEVAFITKEALKIDKEFSRQKQENARLARALLREQTKNKLIQNANRIARASENKKKQEEKWQNKVLSELEEKERLASLRRKQHIHSIREKSKEQESHSETVREKRREIQEEDERTTLQQQKEFLRNKSTSIGRMALNVEEDMLAHQFELSKPPQVLKNRAVNTTAIPPLPSCLPSPTSPRSPSEQFSSEALRKQLSVDALSDEEALKIATQTDGSNAVTVNAAHRAKISKLATDLCRVVPLLGNTLGNASSAGAEESTGQQLGAHSLDLTRADTVLSDFCKVLDQSQIPVDYALVLQLGCVGKVLDICSKIKDSMGAQSLATERNMPPAMKQLSSVMLSALRWLALLSKHKIPRVYLLLTNRVVLLADLAVACLASTRLLEAQNMHSLFLPQALHVLSLHVKQTLPDGFASYRQKLISYLLECGLPEKFGELFAGAGLRGMKLFHGQSQVPFLLNRSMGFLGTLVNAFRSSADRSKKLSEDISADPVLQVDPALQVFRRTDLFGLIGVLGAILFPEKGKPEGEQTRFPQTVVSLAVQAVRILNNTAAINLDTFQDVLGKCQQEFYHLSVCLIDYCVAYQGKPGGEPSQGSCQDENELLHETLSLLGFYCLLQKDHQALMLYGGQGQTLLAKITSLPLYYFMDEKGKLMLFPTIFATCFGSAPNLDLLRNEMNVSWLRNYLGDLLQRNEEAKLPEAAADGFGGRFPIALWQDAHKFFSDEAAVSQV